jgi:hypothetical protein
MTKSHVLSIDVGLRNLSFCLVECSPQIKILVWQRHDVFGHQGDASIGTALPRIVSLLSAFKDVVGITVSIEQQTPKNSRMFAVAHAILAMFLVWDIPVQFMNPKVKFKILRKLQLTADGTTKKRAIAMTQQLLQRQYLQNVVEWVGVFERAKKKDDLADTLLMATAMCVHQQSHETITL